MVKEEPANDEGVHNSRDGVPLIKWTGALGAAGNKLKLLLRKPEYRNKTGLKLYDDPELGKQWREVYLRGSLGVGFNNMKRAMIIKDMLLSSEKTPGADGTLFPCIFLSAVGMTLFSLTLSIVVHR